MRSLSTSSPAPASSLAVAGFVISICAAVVALAALIIAIVALVRQTNDRRNTDATVAEAFNTDPMEGAATPHVYVCGNKQYQLLSSVWDHETSDFKVLYKPLYHVDSKKGKYERHEYAVTHYSRWVEKFKRAQGPVREKEYLELNWDGDRTTAAGGTLAKVVKAVGGKTTSGMGTRAWSGS